jgi:hypothetical protein
MSFLNSYIQVKLPVNLVVWLSCKGCGGRGKLEISVAECITRIEGAPMYVLLEHSGTTNIFTRVDTA